MDFNLRPVTHSWVSLVRGIELWESFLGGVEELDEFFDWTFFCQTKLLLYLFCLTMFFAKKN